MLFTFYSHRCYNNYTAEALPFALIHSTYKEHLHYMRIFLGYLCTLAYLFGLILSFSLMQKKKLISGELTRKSVHILLSFAWVIMDVFWGLSYHQAIMCGIFLVVNTLSYKLKIFPGIERADKDNSPGTIYYALVMFVLSLLSYFFPVLYYPFGASVFALSFGDGFASILPRIIKGSKKLNGNKTLVGAISSMVFSFLAILVFSLCYKVEFSYLAIAGIACLSSIVELCMSKGTDNIGIALSVAGVLVGFAFGIFDTFFYCSLIISYVFLLLAITMGALTPAATLIAYIMLCGASYGAGYQGFLLYMLPFVVIAIIGVIRKKKGLSSSEKRGGLQVLINGGVAFIFFMVYAFIDNICLYIAAAVSISCGFSDSIASDVGAFSKRIPYDIFRRKHVERGVSGGVTVLGSAASLLAAFFMGGIASIREFKLIIFLSVSLFGLLDVWLDTLLGSLVQGLYTCPTCNKVTEKKMHCGEKTQLIKGYSFITNNVVNLVSSLSCTILSLFTLFI